MTLLGDTLFPAADYRRTTASMLAWWESRRGMFNLIVGGTGLVTLITIRLIGLVPPGVQMPIGWQPIVVYGVMANVCYTFGFAVELALKQIMGRRAPAIGPALFRQGVAFSVGLTLLPIVLASTAWVFNVLRFVLR